jgi:dephospho-CoA kinase
MTEQKFEHIFGLQLHDSHKRQRADHVIDTGTSLAETRAQVAALIATL